MNVMSKGRRSADGEIRFPKGIVFVLSAALWGAGCGNDLIHEGGWTEMAAGGPPTIAAELAGDLPEPPYLYGIHDADPRPTGFLDRLNAAGVTGWVTATVAIGSDPNNKGGDDFRHITDAGHGVIVRLNHGYCGEGTIPPPQLYDQFAQRAANYAAATKGAHIFVIGNETNLAHEWAPINGRLRNVTPQSYADVFRRTYKAIKSVRPEAKILSQALAPFAGPYSEGNACGYPHDGQPLNWTQYMRQMLEAIKLTGPLDGIALHINSRGYRYEDIHSDLRVNAGGDNLSFSFKVYEDWIEKGIPADLYHLPLYATEANGIYNWSGGHPERPDVHYERGWVNEIYAEINRYNQTAPSRGRPVFRAVNLYRWCQWCDGWNIDGSPYEGEILADLDISIAAKYRWPDGSGGPPPKVLEGENVAAFAVTAASSQFGANWGPDAAVDGVVSMSSKWTSDGASGEPWLAVDLGVEHQLTGFVIAHASAAGEPAAFNLSAARLESGLSLDGPWQALATMPPATAGKSTISLPALVDARYVRVVVSDAGVDNYARISELEIYSVGVAEAPPPSGSNLASSATSIWTSSNFAEAYGGTAATDGVISGGSKWTSNGATAESWIALDFGQIRQLGRVVVKHAGAAGEPTSYNTRAYRLETAASADGPWNAVAAVDNAVGYDSTESHLTSTSSRFFRMVVTDAGIDNYARIPELEIFSP